MKKAEEQSTAEILKDAIGRLQAAKLKRPKVLKDFIVMAAPKTEFAFEPVRLSVHKAPNKKVAVELFYAYHLHMRTARYYKAIAKPLLFDTPYAV